MQTTKVFGNTVQFWDLINQTQIYMNCETFVSWIRDLRPPSLRLLHLISRPYTITDPSVVRDTTEPPRTLLTLDPEVMPEAKTSRLPNRKHF